MKTGAQAIHPGYGFLSENPEFAQMCGDADIAFIGPAPDQMRAFGLKHTAREIAQKAGVPMSPGTGLLDTPEHALEAAKDIDYPVMLKATGGGGGIGIVSRAPRDQRENELADPHRRLKGSGDREPDVDQMLDVGRGRGVGRDDIDRRHDHE